MKLLIATTAVLSLASLAPLSLAHEFWIKPSKFQIDAGLKLDIQLFVGDGFPGEVVARNGPKIEKFAAFSDAGELPIPGVNGKDPAGSITFEKPGTQVIAFRNLTSRLELEASKFEAYLKEEGLDSIIAKRAELGHSDKPGRELYSRCAKSIVRVGDASQNSPGFDRQVGLRFELIPITNPANIDITKDSGQVFTVKAIYEGKPLASAKIAARTPDDPKLVIKATTDAEGRASLPLTKSGMWLVSAVHMVAAPENSNADWESLWASVTFQAPEVNPPAAPATDAGAAAASQVGQVVTVQVIPRPHESLSGLGKWLA